MIEKHSPIKPSPPKQNLPNNAATLKGNFVFLVPTTMLLNMPARVEVAIKESLIEDFSVFTKKMLPKDSLLVDKIPVGEIMAVQLLEEDTVNRKFRIQALNSEEQILDKKTPSNWAWTVTPIQVGVHKLIVVAKIKLRSKQLGLIGYKDLPVYERAVNVFIATNNDPAPSLDGELVKPEPSIAAQTKTEAAPHSVMTAKRAIAPKTDNSQGDTANKQAQLTPNSLTQHEPTNFYWYLLIPLISLLIWGLKRKYQNRVPTSVSTISTEDKQTILNLIGDDKLEKAIQILVETTPQSKIILSLKGQLARINTDKQTGILDYEEYSKERSKIRVSLLNYIEGKNTEGVGTWSEKR